MTNLAEPPVVFKVNRPEPTPFKPLSERELQILQFYCNGDSSKDIARRLDISQKTVETHRSHLFQKLQVKTGIVNLILAAVKQGIISIGVTAENTALIP